MENIVSITFFLLAIVFLTVGIMLFLTLKRVSVDFYEDHKSRLWGALVLLTLPLSFRSILDGLNNIPKWKAFINKTPSTVAVYNLIFFLITTYLPVLTQISSLVFGYLRSKQ